MNKNIHGNAWVQAVSISVFLFFSLMLAVPSGYSYGATLLLLTGVSFSLRKPDMRLTGEDKILIYALLSIFVVCLFILFLHGDDINTLDQPSRCLLAIPVLLVSIKAPPRLTYMWAGLSCGAIVTAGLATYQIYTAPSIRPTGFVTSAIPFGNLALMMGIFCAAGMFWAKTQGIYAWRWRVALLAGAIAGLYCSIASGSRGGWIALIPVALLFLVAFLDKRNLSKAIAIGSAGLIVMTVAFVIPDSTVRIRYDEAVQEVNNYIQKRDAKTSIGARLEAWRAAAINIPKKPLLGWSYKEYYAEQRHLVTEHELRPFVTTLANTHNNYVEVWLFQGLVGLLALLALYAFPFWFFCKRLRSKDLIVQVLALCGASLLASFFTFGMTHVILGRNNGITFFVLTLVILWGAMRNREINAACRSS